MKARTVLGMLTLLLLPVAHGFDATMTAGLAISIDRIPEPFQVDGLTFSAQRATGRDVPVLAQRIEARWRAQGSTVKSVQQGHWSMRTRIEGINSEVLQWRGSDATLELLLSSVNLRHVGGAAPDPLLRLPAGCTWLRGVSGGGPGQRYLQRSARCNRTASELAAILRSSASQQGWRLRSSSESGMVMDRLGAEALVSLSPDLSASGSWLVWLRVDHEGSPP
jgi:hypothetical protein